MQEAVFSSTKMNVLDAFFFNKNSSKTLNPSAPKYEVISVVRTPQK